MPKVLNKRRDDVSNAIYVGRPTKWGNPYVIGCDGTREEVIEKYRNYIRELIISDLNFLDEIEELRGKDLACWCAPEACHADVLLELANSDWE